MRVRLTPEDRLAVVEKPASWEQHRDKAPALFVQALAAIVATLRDGAEHFNPIATRGFVLLSGAYRSVDEVPLAWAACRRRSSPEVRSATAFV